MEKSLKLGLALLFVFQLVMIAGFELAHDEAYYWLFSRHLDWGYFDHPPFVAAVIALFSFLPHSEFAVRIGFVILQFGTLFLLFRMTLPKDWRKVFLLFFAFPLASYTGLLALPDMPLLFMSAVYFYLLKKFLDEDKRAPWFLGVAIALLLYAKYHGILLVFFTILALPKLLLRKEFWMVAIVSLVLFSPHMLWQYQHDFPTLRYHFLERPSSSFSIKRILDYIGTQILLSGFLAGPVLWWQMRKVRATTSFERVLIFNAWGIFFFFLISTFSKKVEANWTISLVIPLILLLVQHPFWAKKNGQIILVASFTVVVFLRLVFLFPSLPIKRMGEFHGWKNWAQVVDDKCGGKKILANSYQIASKLSFYLNREISALNLHSRKNHFDLWDREIMGEVCYVTDKSGFEGEEIETPEMKKLRVVRNFTGEALLLRKIEENTQDR